MFALKIVLVSVLSDKQSFKYGNTMIELSIVKFIYYYFIIIFFLFSSLNSFFLNVFYDECEEIFFFTFGIRQLQQIFIYICTKKCDPEQMRSETDLICKCNIQKKNFCLDQKLDEFLVFLFCFLLNWLLIVAYMWCILFQQVFK